MKKIFTLLSTAFFVGNIFAGTPTLDGTITSGEGWGSALVDNTADADGWFETKVNKLYVTSDANFLYLGAEIKARKWQQFAFLVNSKVGGGATDSWGRSIIYTHADAPDLIVRGNLQGEGMTDNNYAGVHTWNTMTSAWDNTGVNYNASGEFVKDNIVSDDAAVGFVEVKVPLSSLTFFGSNNQIESLMSAIDVQAIMTGNNNEHGIFDAAPNATNATGWNMTATPNDAFSYAAPVSLAVDLTYFTGKNVNETASLEWATASEKNNSHFDIERSFDGVSFEKIGTVKGNGTTNAEKTYNFRDFTATTGINYYRLRQVDFDGKDELSSVVGISMGKKSRLKVFPNPTADRLYLDLSATLNTEGASARIFDALGRTVFVEQLDGKNEVQVAHLPRGAYRVQFISGNGQTMEVANFVKE
jgi:hypothetical protein